MVRLYRFRILGALLNMVMDFWIP